MAILTFFNLASFVDYITPFSRVTPGAVELLWLNSRVLRGDSPGGPMASLGFELESLSACSCPACWDPASGEVISMPAYQCVAWRRAAEEWLWASSLDEGFRHEAPHEYSHSMGPIFLMSAMQPRCPKNFGL